MRYRRYEMLLPARYEDGRWVSDQAVRQTQDDLLTEFGGKSKHPFPVLWARVQGGPRFEERALCLIVDVEDTAENQQFFIRFKAVLRKRFEQADMYIVSWPI